MGKFLAPSISTADRIGLVLDEREIVFDTDLDSLWIGDGSTAGGIEVGAGGGGTGGITTFDTVTDANFTLVDGTGYYIPSSTFTANRTVDVSGLTTEAEIYNGNQSYILSFTGADVYGYGGDQILTECWARLTTRLRKVGSKILIIN